jgi:hypothetical protein
MRMNHKINKRNFWITECGKTVQDPQGIVSTTAVLDNESMKGLSIFSRGLRVMGRKALLNTIRRNSTKMGL